MSLSKNNLVIGAFILTAFIGIGVFGLLEWSHLNHSEAPMINCFYAESGLSVCKNTLDHITAWQKFSNIIFSSFLLFFFSVFFTILYRPDKDSFFNPVRLFSRWKYNLYDKELNNCPNRIIKWLSLFENSPSFATQGIAN